MRTLSAEGVAMQQARASRARVSCSLSTMGFTYNDPGYSWSVLVGNTSLAYNNPVAAYPLANGKVLRWVNTGYGVEQQTIDDPSVAADWESPSATVQVIAGGVNALAVASDGSVLRLYTGEPAGTGIRYRESSDWGATWGGPVTVTTRACADDLQVRWDPVFQGGAWVVCWSNGDGAFIGWDDGSWTEVQYTTSARWQAAGTAPATVSYSLGCYFREEAGNTGPSTIIHCYYNPASGFSSQAEELDRLQGGVNGMRHYVARVGVCGGMRRAWILETGYANGATAALGTFLHERSMDEPVAFPDWPYQQRVDMFDQGGNAYIVGLSMVIQGVPKSVSADAFVPIKYTYQGGRADMLFPATVPTITEGDRLDVVRTLRDNDGNEESESLRLWVGAVSRWTDKVEVVAYDAVGYLGIQRARRMSVVLGADALNSYESVVWKLGARAGVAGWGIDAGLVDQQAPVMNLRPGENYASAFLRLASRRSLYLVPSPTDFSVWVIEPGVDAEYVAYTPYSYGPDGHPLIRAGTVTDGRRFSQAFVMGQTSLDPEDGVSIYVADGPRLATVRPISMGRISQFLNSDAKREETGDALVEYQQRQAVDAKLESWVNLGLELYDKIEVTESALGWDGKCFLVVGIKETWEQGLLRQELDLREWPFA